MEFKSCVKRREEVILKSHLTKNKRTFCSTNPSHESREKEIVDPDEYKDCDVKPILIILDDCVNENSVRTSPYLRLLAIGGRHIMISCIILSQVVAGKCFCSTIS